MDMHARAQQVTQVQPWIGPAWLDLVLRCPPPPAGVGPDSHQDYRVTLSLSHRSLFFPPACVGGKGRTPASSVVAVTVLWVVLVAIPLEAEEPNDIWELLASQLLILMLCRWTGLGG